jgi:hypothetical protein
MNPNSTEELGIKEAMKYECKKGRIAQRVHKCGYDLISKGRGGERHIEVKATAKNRFTFRWLEPLEYKKLQKDKRFYLYLVTNVRTKPKMKRYNRTQLMSKSHKKVCHYVFVFSDDFPV